MSDLYDRITDPRFKTFAKMFAGAIRDPGEIIAENREPACDCESLAACRHDIPYYEQQLAAFEYLASVVAEEVRASKEMLEDARDDLAFAQEHDQ